MSEILTPITISVIGLIIEYWIIQPIRDPERTLNDLERRLIRGATIIFPIAAIILVVLYIRSVPGEIGKLGEKLTVARDATPIDSENKYFVDLLVLIGLTYSMGIAICFIFRHKISTFFDIKQVVIQEDRDEYRSRLWKMYKDYTPKEELTEREKTLAAVLALLRIVFLFIPLFLVWVQVFIHQLNGFAFLLLTSLSILLFNSIFLVRYRVELQKSFKSRQSRIDVIYPWLLLNGGHVLWTSVVTGIICFPFYLIAYRYQGYASWGWKIFLVSLLTAFIVIPLLWVIIVKLLKILLSGLVIYLFDRLDYDQES